MIHHTRGGTTHGAVCNIWVLCRRASRAEAIQKTFAKRGTHVEADPVCFTQQFAGDAGKRVQWQAFVRKSRLESVAGEFSEVVSAVAAFLSPVATALASQGEFQGDWPPGGPWTMTTLENGR